jgi:hypothetical protein
MCRCAYFKCADDKKPFKFNLKGFLVLGSFAEDSPRLRCAWHPSLRLRRKEGVGNVCLRISLRVSLRIKNLTQPSPKQRASKLFS